MAIISREHGYLFILNPRTGCTAIANGALIPHLGGEWLPPSDVRGGDGALLAPQKHTTVAQLRRAGLITDEQLRDLFVLVGVRNPFDSLVSLYEKIRQNYVRHFDDPTHWMHNNPRQVRLMKVAAEDGFNAWVRAKYPRAKVRKPLMFQAPFMEAADFFIRLEQLQEDFSEAMTKVGLSGVEVPRINTTKRERDYRPFYDRRSRRRIERVFAPSFARFGYRF